jgi:Family of unknown function (DUF6876)
MTNQSTLTHANLRQFTGDLERFWHSLAPEVIYTPGVKFVAESGSAYWLIDEIALAIAWGEILKAGETDPRILELHFWRLEVKDDSAKLTARADSDVPPYLYHEYSNHRFLTQTHRHLGNLRWPTLDALPAI